MTKEEIFEKHSKVFYDANDYGTRVLTRWTYGKAMQEYSDLQNKELIEENKHLQASLLDVANKSAERVKELESQLAELKEKRYRDIQAIENDNKRGFK